MLATYTTTIRERIGWGFLFKYRNNSGACDNDFFIQDLCYSDNTFGTHQYSQLDCFYQNPVGLTKNSMEVFDLTLFPNPASGTLNVKLNAQLLKYKAFLLVKDAMGRTIILQPVVNQTEYVDVKELPTGFYILQVVYNGSVISHSKFAKE